MSFSITGAVPCLFRSHSVALASDYIRRLETSFVRSTPALRRHDGICDNYSVMYGLERNKYMLETTDDSGPKGSVQCVTHEGILKVCANF